MSDTLENVPEQAGQAAHLVKWLNTILRVQGHGSRSAAADILGITPSGLSYMLKRPNGVDEKTVRLVTWLITSKHDPNDIRLPIETIDAGGWLWRHFKNEDGSSDWTWETL